MRAGLGLGIAALLAFVGARLSHQVGIAQGRTERTRLLDDLAAQERLSRALAERGAVAEQRAEEASRRATQLQQALAASQPTSEVKTLTDLVKARLAGGVPPQRLEFVLREVRGERACEPVSERRRLRVQVPTATEPAASAVFATGRIAVSAEGSPRSASSSLAAGEFDPALPVTVRFRPIGRDASTVSGTLPLAHALVLDAAEFLFLIRADARASRLELTAQACRFP